MLSRDVSATSSMGDGWFDVNNSVHVSSCDGVDGLREFVLITVVFKNWE